ncbi:peroxiredoxin (plasmid) [Deinococcus aetherius]|uniref:Peroxiredoxin n=1 Tax=Deinococcus aetherius TaxID=200252 RepID=A0ABM8AJG5_9DEIO|nr:peroxiredoxin family protein [Deinococcus aetherius]BDP43840.1 peroxiredoxin [Deinococcus aetherius]
MTQTQSPALRLQPGAAFPALSAPLLGGGTLTLPQDALGAWSVVLLYRGDWCPYCRTQLTDFQRAAEKYAAAGVRVFALSADTEEEAQKTLTRHALTLPVAYGLNPGAVARSHGASTGEDGAYLQATGFVLRPDGTVALSLYSSGAVGRLNAADTLGFIQYLQKH